MSTPLNKITISNKDIFIKDESYFGFAGGGNKGRKIKRIYAAAIQQGYNAIVTAGSAQSNHVYASALMAAQAGWKATFVIHDQEPSSYTGHLKIVKLTGAKLVFTTLSNVKAVMDAAMDDLKSQGYTPLYVYGGGHGLEGSIAHYEAIEELYEQMPMKNLDYIFVASGTGGTQAGLVVGARQFFPSCKVIGISVARDKHRGANPVYTSAADLADYLHLKISISFEDIFFDDRFIGPEYGAIYPDLIETINTAASSGVLVDPTYTGKAFHGMLHYIHTGKVSPDSIIVFWHTGGLINLLSSEYI